MKTVFVILVALLIGMEAHAQSDFISSSPVNDEDCIADLQGRGGILLLSDLGDLVITIGNVKSPQITPKGKRGDGQYVYEIVIDPRENKTPKVEVNRRGEIYKTDFVVSLRPDFMRAYRIEYVKTPIRMEDQTKGNDAILDEKLTEVEISTTIKDLQVWVSPKLNAQVARSAKKTDNSIYITTVVIPWAVIKEAKDRLEQLRKAHADIYSYIDKNADKASEADYDKELMLKNQLSEAESAYNAMMHIDVYANGTNREQIDLEPLRPRVKLCYGVLLLKQIEKVYVTECSAMMTEGARLYGLRQYDASRRAFANALNAKDTPADLVPSIHTNIQQCDTCLLYERYALGSLVKMKEMRQAGEASQKDVVRYASGALDFLSVLNKYNPCDFYAERIEKLRKLIEDMPLDLRFTIAKWVSDYSGVYEDGKLAGVELWAYFGTDDPHVKMYQSDKSFVKMIDNAKATDFKQLGESDADGVIEVHLSRKDLPQGFFFRPAAYGDRVKILYMDAQKMMLRSEGEYNKRQVRIRMYTRVGK